MESPSLTILMPCLNEERQVALVVAEYRAAFPRAEVLVVDNGSEDGTAAAARSAGAAVITEKRRGKARAVATALAAIDTDLVLMVDGDGSYPAEGASLLLTQYLREPADMISGIRSAQNASNVFRPMHQWGMSIFAAVLNLVFRFKPLDLFSGLRLFSRRFYQHVPVLSRSFELEIELTIQAIDKGFSMMEIPVPFRSRANGSTSKLKTVSDGTDSSVAPCSFPRLPATGFLRNIERTQCRIWSGGGIAAGDRISSHRSREPAAAGRISGQLDDPVDANRPGRSALGSQPALPPRGISHSVAKISRAAAESTSHISASVRGLRSTRCRPFISFPNTFGRMRLRPGFMRNSLPRDCTNKGAMSGS